MNVSAVLLSLLVGLANAQSLMNSGSAARIGMTLPFVQYETRFDKDQTEMKLIRRLYQEDYRAMADKAAEMFKDKPKSPYVNMEGYIVQNELYDTQKNPLESFLVYEPIVKSIVEESPQSKAIIESLLRQQKHAVGLKAWIERNSPSIKLAAFSTPA